MKSIASKNEDMLKQHLNLVLRTLETSLEGQSFDSLAIDGKKIGSVHFVLHVNSTRILVIIIADCQIKKHQQVMIVSEKTDKSPDVLRVIIFESMYHNNKYQHQDFTISETALRNAFGVDYLGIEDREGKRVIQAVVGKSLLAFNMEGVRSADHMIN